MLDVFIGIIFLYLLLSFICSAINEIVEGILKRRAADLHRGIHELLHNNQDNRLLDKLYTHPLIASLYRGKYNSRSKKNLPSYIPASNFAWALLDIILPASSTTVSGAAGGGTPESEITGNVSSLKSLRKAVLDYPNFPVQQAVLALIDAAEGDINKVRQNIESWYNSSMDRVAGWYKRRVQMILLFLGIFLAVAMNADTISIFKSLANDPALRNSLVSASAEYAKTTVADAQAGKPEERIEANLQKINALRLPIGWDWQDNRKVGLHQSNASLAIPNSVSGWVSKVIGWVITGLAVSLGAPFWFDLLNKMMVIRSTVKPHEKSQEEASEDRQ
ncbi:hypothetical protein AHMF7605_01670 [Adhaeribacter arboris]|uniref:Uncharacterized protein n=2 Tax=Adhaeribacter arboris TaxID=2072846 RepID=A0A2T2Y9Y0_9BACT|nr:hypothetical protein AHMF7605_01670 [Adhaeribacter arboris]